MAISKLLGKVECSDSHPSINGSDTEREPSKYTHVFRQNLTDRANTHGMVQWNTTVSDNQIVTCRGPHTHGVPLFNDLQAWRTFGDKKRPAEQSGIWVLDRHHNHEEVDNWSQTGECFAAIEEVGVSFFHCPRDEQPPVAAGFRFGNAAADDLALFPTA